MVISDILPSSVCVQSEAFSHFLIIISDIGCPVNDEASHKGVDWEWDREDETIYSVK
jgi:hypothetical protein